MCRNSWLYNFYFLQIYKLFSQKQKKCLCLKAAFVYLFRNQYFLLNISAKIKALFASSGVCIVTRSSAFRVAVAIGFSFSWVLMSAVCFVTCFFAFNLPKSEVFSYEMTVLFDFFSIAASGCATGAVFFCGISSLSRSSKSSEEESASACGAGCSFFFLKILLRAAIAIKTMYM